DDPDAVGELGAADRIRVLVEEPECAVHRQVGERAHAEAEQDTLLHPRVGAPDAVRPSLSTAYRAGGPRRAEFGERRALAVPVAAPGSGGERLDALTQRHAPAAATPPA